ncbi:ribonucleoprotein RB97D [Stomoxys calcitrans]|uniref:RRM domain-containing protein n=1 Tax=Stomoxys calcitrans TaxID=35570 RepID=A0A1I8PPR0_STOCA|nr:ribonucleoprotein RB97D [Stomoxys calcitrans]
MVDVIGAPYTDIQQNKMYENDNYSCKLFLGGLSPNTTEESITNFYAQYGEVASAVVKRDPTTQRSKGFGFITYKDSSSIERAQSLKPHIIDGRNVDSKPALPRSETNRIGSNDNVRKIFVGGLKDNHDEQNLQDHFQQFGNVLTVKVLLDRTTGRKRGFGFVEFDTCEAADRAVFHKNHTIDQLPVEVKKSNYRQEQANRGSYQHGGSSGSYSQVAYTQNPSYNYPQASYNGWTGHTTHYAQQPQTMYEGYAAAPVQSNPPTAYNGWEEQNNYNAAPPPGAANGWNAGQSEGQFGSYQHSHGGGPQKGHNLQNNRRNPYNV